MKKLSKLNLKDFREMSDFEMKHVLGGSSSSVCEYYGVTVESCDCP